MNCYQFKRSLSGHNVDSDIPKENERNLSDGAEGVAYQDEGVSVQISRRPGMVSDVTN